MSSGPIVTGMLVISPVVAVMMGSSVALVCLWLSSFLSSAFEPYFPLLKNSLD